MSKENPSKDERIENAKRRTAREFARISRNREAAAKKPKEPPPKPKPKEKLPKALSWLFKNKNDDNGK